MCVYVHMYYIYILSMSSNSPISRDNTSAAPSSASVRCTAAAVPLALPRTLDGSALSAVSASCLAS